MVGWHRLRAATAVVYVAAQILGATPAFAHESHGSAGRAEDDVLPDPATLGGPFTLTDHTGRPVTDRTFRGGWMFIYFGYTGCREGCPTALVSMTQALEELGPDADRIQPLFIDFSMEEPDLPGLAQFVSNFHPRLIGLAGTRAQTFAAVRQFKVRRDFQFGNYSPKETGSRIDHTTFLYLVDPNGVTRAYFHHAMPADEMAKAIRGYLDGRGGHG